MKPDGSSGAVVGVFDVSCGGVVGVFDESCGGVVGVLDVLDVLDVPCGVGTVDETPLGTVGEVEPDEHAPARSGAERRATATHRRPRLAPCGRDVLSACRPAPACETC
ncbi:MAG: hypothetical protein ABIV94_03170 [Acidimicrobiales bacterium]